MHVVDRSPSALKMNRFSVVIPARNAAKTIDRCLAEVFRSAVVPSEVIVVNDGSRDQTSEIVLEYPCRVVSVDIGKGPMQARFAGARIAEHPILIFVDADVCVKRDTFERILMHFEDESVHALTGVLSYEERAGSFFSNYKNVYMNYIFRKQPRESQFLYGSLWGVRKKDLIFFEPISDQL